MFFNRSVSYRGFSCASAIFAVVALSSCFTGVESTPRITYKDVKSNNAATVSAEEALAARFSAQPFSTWTSGKRFYVTSPRISLALSLPPGIDAPMPTAGDTITLTRISETTGLTGTGRVEIEFDSLYIYRTNASLTELRKREAVDVPFSIDLALVDSVASELRGRNLYVRTPLWFTTTGDAYNGRKFVPIHVVDVVPANEVYPVMVIFTDEQGETHALFMSAGNSTRWASRDFAALFSLTDPRKNYPTITNEMWQNIVNTRVAIGMTKPEVTLAIGSPESIDRGHNQSSAYECWNYTDGRAVVFEDGIVVRFNR